MFHTFQASSSANNPSSSKNNPKTRRQSSTTHACEECRRRKIRCDGKQPCSHCEWYKHPKLCKYSKKQPRIVPSQKLLDELSNSLKQSQNIIEQLFPNADLNQLGNMPRSDLINLILGAATTSSQPDSSNSASPTQHGSEYQPTRSKSEDSSANLEALEQEPEPDANWDESKLDSNGVPPISDDVNALSMTVSRQSSYLGVSSIAAALRVISKITTALESVILSSPHGTAQPTRSNSPGRNAGEVPTSAGLSSTISSPSLDHQTLVDAYFAHVHPMIPMIDETRFRHHFLANERRDPGWLALLNTVFAMGTVAASTSDDNSHLMYYNCAKSYLDLEIFGSGHIEALQALGILGGYYLHYENRPNMASAVMGAAMRMACALGLHREYAPEQASSSQAQSNQVRQALLIPREVRRRTWWSLFCLDTWASTTTGRPSLGRISNGVTVQAPQSLSEGESPISGNLTDEETYVAIIREEAAFCKIATRVQDRLAEQPLLPYEETRRFDSELQHWYANLPIMLRWPEPCPERARTPRAVMSWRYHNLRLILYRPVLLNNALRSSLDNTDLPSEDEVKMVETCRQIAGEAITDIQQQWYPNQIMGWNAVWLLFQASMVPLVTLFAEYNRNNINAVREAQSHVESVLSQLNLMTEYSITARRSKDVVAKIYERNKLMMAYAREFVAQQQQQQQQNQTQLKGEQDQFWQQGQQFPQQSHPPHHHQQQSQQDQFQQHHHHSSSVDLGQQQSPSHVIPSHDMSGGWQSQHELVGSPHSLQTLGPNPQSGNALYTGAVNTGQQQQQLHQMENPGFMGMGIGPEGQAAAFVNEDELNTFWNQIMWGEGDVPSFMTDANLGFMPYGSEGGQVNNNPGSYPFNGGGVGPGPGPDPGGQQ